MFYVPVCQFVSVSVSVNIHGMPRQVCLCELFASRVHVSIRIYMFARVPGVLCEGVSLCACTSRKWRSRGPSATVPCHSLLHASGWAFLSG